MKPHKTRQAPEPMESTLAPTPGPWVISGEFDEGVSVFVCTEKGGEICEIELVDGSWHTEEVANSHLIAAAPDLLAALKGWVYIQDGLDAELMKRGVPKAALIYAPADRARAAVAKAEGREK